MAFEDYCPNLLHYPHFGHYLPDSYYTLFRKIIFASENDVDLISIPASPRLSPVSSLPLLVKMESVIIHLYHKNKIFQK